MSIAKLLLHNDLVEAYEGYYEDEAVGDNALQTPEAFSVWIEAKIRKHTPKERLEVYLEWNGILGYTNRIYDIATGKFEE